MHTKHVAARCAELAVALVAVCALGCGDAVPSGAGCLVNADCVSGSCGADGICAPEADGGASDAGHVDAGNLDAGTADAGGTDAGPIDGGNTGCVPNNDATLTRAEVPIATGVGATFRIATDFAVSTAGTSEGGTTTWDFSTALPNDHDARVTVEPMDDQWFKASFPTATYAAQLRDASDVLGVFRSTADALVLLGVASRTKSTSWTELIYATPITVLKFPMKQGDHWTTTSSATGTASGVSVLFGFSETYTTDVDKSGIAKTPFGSFPVLRVNTQLDRTVGFLITHSRTHAFATECFGTIARLSSTDGATTPEFQQAAELQRLAP